MNRRQMGWFVAVFQGAIMTKTIQDMWNTTDAVMFFAAAGTCISLAFFAGVLYSIEARIEEEGVC